MSHESQTGELFKRLDIFIGEWRLEAPAFPIPTELADDARAIFEWTLDGTFLLERSYIPGPAAPNGLCLVGLDGDDGYTQHYFDSRGIARVYAMTFDGRDWTLERTAPDFTPLSFHQRWFGTFSTDRTRIEGAGNPRRTAARGNSTSNSPTIASRRSRARGGPEPLSRISRSGVWRRSRRGPRRAVRRRVCRARARP